MLSNIDSKKLKFINGDNAIFIYLFWLSLALFSLTLLGELAILFVNPNKISNYSNNEIVFLGFYSLNVSTKVMWLNWAPYLLGCLIVINTLINCVSYWWLKMRCPIYVWVNINSLVVIFISSISVGLIFFVANIFNRPLINFDSLDFISNGWNSQLGAGPYASQFNYVYNINFLNDANNNCYLSLNKFSALWIIIIVISLIVYITSFIIFIYRKQCSFAIIYFDKDYYND